MKTDLANSWILMSLLPYGVADDPEYRNKYVACLIGDELATWPEFLELGDHPFGTPVQYRENGMSCKFNYSGSCFHPFLPGSMVDAIFSDCMRGHDNAGPLVNETACRALDHRSCRGCCLHMARVDDDSAFAIVERFYDSLFDILSKEKYLYWKSFDEFMEKDVGHAATLSDKKFLLGGSAQYEENVRDHFEKMMRRHFQVAFDASRSGGGKIENEENAVAKALLSIRMDLVTHWRNYWVPGKYKVKEI